VMLYLSHIVLESSPFDSSCRIALTSKPFNLWCLGFWYDSSAESICYCLRVPMYGLTIFIISAARLPRINAIYGVFHPFCSYLGFLTL